jgi:quercetin dioxygenase-like cupin family protein
MTMAYAGLVVVIALSLVANRAFAGGPEVFDVNREAAKTNPKAEADSRYLVKAPQYTVNAVVVRKEIPTHQHPEGNHVLYIVSGRGTATVDGQPVSLKPGVLVHIPHGIVHSIRAQGGKLTFVDFVQHASDPSQTSQDK